MSRIRLQYLFQDRPCDPETELSDYDSLDLVSNGCHLYGEIMWPDGSYSAPRPCVVLFHGFPGSARNDDLAHALCRIGCVVLTPHHRGAWGSEGSYLVSNCIEDALAIAGQIRSEGFRHRYHIDPDAVFLIGHSMGANTVIHAARRLAWLRGIVALTPLIPSVTFKMGRKRNCLRCWNRRPSCTARDQKPFFRTSCPIKIVWGLKRRWKR